MQQNPYSDRLDEDTDGDLSTGERDVTPRLVHLGDRSELQVADGNPDIRGWDVRTAAGEKIGTVKDLVVDTRLMKVRYIEAQIDSSSTSNADDDRHVLLPIGSARLDDDKDDVYLSASVVDPRTLPRYSRDSLSREYEVSLRERFPGDTGTNPASMSMQNAADSRTEDDTFYTGELYDDANFLGTRRRGQDSANYIGPNTNDVNRGTDNSL